MGVVKRVLPFLVTFAAGLFIASFFVTIAPMGSGSYNADGYGCRHGSRRYMKREMRQLRRENFELKRMLSDSGMNVDDISGPSVTEPVAPPPPPPPQVR